MYRLVPLPDASEPKPSRRSVFVGLAAVILLSLLGLISLGVISYYLPATSTKAYWFISRSSGVIAYVVLTIGVLWGLVQSGALFRTRFAPLLAFGLHNYLSWIGLGISALHAIVLTGDTYTHFSLFQIAVPFSSQYRPIPVGLGIIGLYLMLLLTLSFYARRFIGQRGFRLLHYISFGVFAMVTLHGVYGGTDTGALWWLYSASLLAVVMLTTLRIVSKRRSRKPKANAARAASAYEIATARQSEAVN